MSGMPSRSHLFLRCLLLCGGLTTMAFGVALSIRADLGTSPISSVPYVTGVISGLSVGTTTIIMNTLFVLMQIAILRSRYQWFQLLQIPAAVLFGGMIDVGEWLLGWLVCSRYLQQWLACGIGIVLVALGVSLEVTAGLVTTAGEGVVLAICQVFPVKFGNMKVAFDITLVGLSVITGLLCLGHLSGVGEGTVAAALLVGLVTKQVQRPMRYFAARHLA